MPDRGCASLGGHMGGKDDVERWTSLYKGFTRPGRGKKLPEPDDATLRRLREVESRAAPVSIAPPAPTTNRRERPSAGHATPAADPPPPPSSANDDTPPPTDELPAAATNAPAPASDVQPRRRRQNKAELAEAQAAAKREAVRVAVRHAMGGALAEDPHLRRLEAAAKLEAEVERARAMAMGAGDGAGDGANDGASAHPRNGSSNPRQPPARRTKPTASTSRLARLTPASPPPPSLTWEQHDAFLTYPPTRARYRHELPRGLKTSDLDALYRAVEREQRRFLAHVAQAARGVCASMGPRGMVRAAREWASRDVARRVDPKTGDAPRYVTPAASPAAGPGLAHAFSLVTGLGKWESDELNPSSSPAVLSLESVRRTGGSRDKPPSRPSSRLGGSVVGGVDDKPSAPSRRGSASNLSAFSGDSGGTRPHPTEAPIPPALLAACGRGVRLGEFVSALNPPLATALESDAPFVPGEDEETNAICESTGASAALTEGALACLVANAPGRLDRAWDLPVAICAWDGNDDDDDSKDGSIGDVNGDVNGDERNRRINSRRRPAVVVHIGDPLPTRDCSPATWRARAAATYERAIARRVEDARRVRELERLSQRGPLGSLSGDVPPPVHFATAHDGCVPVVRTHAVFSLGERKIVVRSTDMEVEAGDGSAQGGGKEVAETVRCKVEFTEDPDALVAGDLRVDCVEEEASWAEAARWWCALAARGGDPGIQTSEGGSANGVGVVRDLTVVLCRVRARDGSVARPPERFDADEILRRFCRDPPPPPSEMARTPGGGGGGVLSNGSTRAASRGTSLGDSGDDSGDDDSGDDDAGAATDPPHWFRGHGFDPAHGIQNVASAIDALATLPLGRYLLRHDVGSDVAEVFKEVAGPDGSAPTRGATMRRSTFDASRSDSPGGGVGGVSGRRRGRPAAGSGSGPPRRGKPPATAIHIPSGGRRTFGGRRMKNGGKRGHLFGGFSGVEEEEERPPPKSAKRLMVLPEIPMGMASALFIGSSLEDPKPLRRGAGSLALAGAKNSKDFEPMPGPRDVGAECAVGVGYDWAAGHEKCADAERDSDEEDADGKPREREECADADRLLGFEFLPPVCHTEGQIDRTPAPRGDPGAGRAKARRDQKRGNWRAVLAPPAKESSEGRSSDDSDSADDVPIAGLLARERTNGARSESDDDVPIAGLLARSARAGGSKKKAGAIARSRRKGGAKGGGGKEKTAGKERDAPPAAAASSSDDDDDDDVELEVDDDGHYVGVRYCRPFAHAGRCVRKGKCPDPHLTLREVRRMAARGESNEHAMREVRQRVYATFAAVNAGRHHQHTQQQQQRAPAWGNMPSLGGTRKASWARAANSDEDDD